MSQDTSQQSGGWRQRISMVLNPQQQTDLKSTLGQQRTTSDKNIKDTYQQTQTKDGRSPSVAAKVDLPSQPAAFPVRLLFPRGEQLILRPEMYSTVAQFLTEAKPLAKEYLDASLNYDILTLVTEDGVMMQRTDIISENPYVKKLIGGSTMPLLSVAVGLMNDAPPATVEDDSKGRQAAIVYRKPSINKAHTMKQLQQVTVQFLLPGGQTIVLKCQTEVPIREIKEQLRAEWSGKLHKALKPMEHYVLKTTGSEGYLNDENLTLSELPFIEACRKQSTTPKLIVVEKSGALSKKEKIINVEIGSLIGSPLCWTQEDSEVSQFRKSHTWVRYQISKNQQSQRSASPEEQNSGNLPVKLASTPLDSPPSKLMIKLKLPLLPGAPEKTVIANEGESATKFTGDMFVKYYSKVPALAAVIKDKKPTDYILKVVGLGEYIAGPHDMTQFEYIRNCISKKVQPQLCIVDKSEVESTEDNSDLYVEDFPSEELLADPVYNYDHEEIKSASIPWDQLTSISIWELSRPFRVKIIGVENLKRLDSIDSNTMIYITAGLYHGGELVAPLMTSQQSQFSNTPRWYEWASTNIQMCNIPRATRICFTVWAKSATSSKDIPLGWVACQLFDYKHELRTGLMSLNMWPEEAANPIGPCVGNNNDTSSAVLFIEFDTYPMPVVFPTEPMRDLPPEYNSDMRKPTISSKASKLIGIDNDAYAQIESLINKDPLYPVTLQDKKALWQERDYCKSKPRSLPKFLQAVAYNDRFAVQVMHSMLEEWASINTVDALELLDSKFADSKVRAYAVKALEQLTDDELGSYLLQLVQVLKYEPYHDNALARFLLQRALHNRTIGHSLFWFLKSEMHVPYISERFGLLLESYLRGCGSHRAELKKQTAMIKDLVRVANFIKPIKDSERREALLNELKKLQMPSKVQLPLDPAIEVNGFIYEKCKYMDSKKLPLWLVFTNSDSNGASKYVIFKSGDDLRQDMLTLQMIRLMDKLWKHEGLDLQLNPYGCISTGDEEGMIEVVLNSNTIANITKEAGGATAAFRTDPLANWLREANPSESQYTKAVDNFILSCAGYCVATYVLGIGDRHNDNVMCTRDGRLFHIDFGHFLGNFKKKFGIKRERAPFVFTPDFAYVMGGRDSKDFMKFVDRCCKAYNILRKHANVFINLFAMMLSTGIPELTSAEDIGYLREAFSLDMNDEKAREKFTNLIYYSLTTKTTQLNNAIHILAH